MVDVVNDSGINDLCLPLPNRIHSCKRMGKQRLAWGLLLG